MTLRFAFKASCLAILDLRQAMGQLGKSLVEIQMAGAPDN
jgi:hypothetical protein